SGGYLQFASGAVPTTGSITVNGNGSLIAAGAQTTVMGWLSSGKVATASTGSIAITGSSSENIDFTANGGYNSLALSSTGAATYSGTITAGSNGYLFGGDASTNLTVSTALSAIGNNIRKVSTAGTVTLSTVNLTGAATINGTGTADSSAQLR